MNNTQDLPPRFFDAVERLDGDVTLLREMAAVTSEDLPGVADEAEEAIDNQECEQAVSSLHKLKGMLSTFETQGITLEIQDMLNTARAGDIRSVKQMYQINKRGIHELIDQIANLSGGSK